MSGVGGFLKRHRMMFIVPTVLAGEFYLWWKIQYTDRYVPQHERQEILVRPLDYAKKLYEGSMNKDHRSKEKSV